MLVSIGSVFVALLFGVLIASAFWFLVAVLLGKGQGRGGPADPVCVLHLHRHQSQQLWHRGQVYHDHDHQILPPGGDPGEDEFVPSPQSVEEACNAAQEYTGQPSCCQEQQILDKVMGGQLPVMRLASGTEAYTSAKLPEPSANGKPRARNIERQELARNTDLAAFPSAELTLAADRADMAGRPGREVCLAEQGGAQAFLPARAPSGKF